MKRHKTTTKLCPLSSGLSNGSGRIRWIHYCSQQWTVLAWRAVLATTRIMPHSPSRTSPCLYVVPAPKASKPKKTLANRAYAKLCGSLPKILCVPASSTLRTNLCRSKSNRPVRFVPISAFLSPRREASTHKLENLLPSVSSPPPLTAALWRRKWTCCVNSATKCSGFLLADDYLSVCMRRSALRSQIGSRGGQGCVQWFDHYWLRSSGRSRPRAQRHHAGDTDMIWHQREASAIFEIL